MRIYWLQRGASGVGRGDADNDMPAASFGRQHVPQMIVVEDLEPSMRNAEIRYAAAVAAHEFR